jgi:hypothetical protein
MEKVIKNYLDNVDKVEEELAKKKKLLNKFDNIFDLFNFLYVGNLTKDLSLYDPSHDSLVLDDGLFNDNEKAMREALGAEFKKRLESIGIKNVGVDDYSWRLGFHIPSPYPNDIVIESLTPNHNVKLKYYTDVNSLDQLSRVDEINLGLVLKYFNPMANTGRYKWDLKGIIAQSVYNTIDEFWLDNTYNNLSLNRDYLIQCIDLFRGMCEDLDYYDYYDFNDFYGLLHGLNDIKTYTKRGERKKIKQLLTNRRYILNEMFKSKYFYYDRKLNQFKRDIDHAEIWSNTIDLRKSTEDYYRGIFTGLFNKKVNIHWSVKNYDDDYVKLK